MKNKLKLSLLLTLIVVFFSSSIYATSLPNTVLTYMSRGDSVVQVQNALNNIGSNISVDGIYGRETKIAVLNFQRKHSSLSNDGIYGPSTKIILEKALQIKINEVKEPQKTSKPELPKTPEVKGKVAYLTFDDGPSRNVTPQILKILDDYDIKATFFMLGNMAEKNADLVKKVHEKGHSIGNHSYSHDYKHIYANTNNLLNEAYKTQAIFKDILGQQFSSRLFRFPGGSSGKNKAPYRKAINQVGFDYYDWNALNGDSEGHNLPAKTLVSRMKETVRSQEKIVVLMHDSSTKETTAQALPEIIEYLKGQGYAFDKLNE